MGVTLHSNPPRSSVPKESAPPTPCNHTNAQQDAQDRKYPTNTHDHSDGPVERRIPADAFYWAQQHQHAADVHFGIAGAAVRGRAVRVRV